MCISSNSVNQAQDLMFVTKFEDFPNSLLPSIYVTCVIITSRLVDNLVLFQITVIMNMSGVEECEGECWAGWDTWDYWSSVWIEGVILPAIAALGIAGRRQTRNIATYLYTLQ